MSELTLGSTVSTLTVRLTGGADFNTTLTNAEGNWPQTAVIELRFTDGPTWRAIIDGPDAVFAQDKDDVDALLTGRHYRVGLWYIDGDADLCWATGSVQVA